MKILKSILLFSLFVSLFSCGNGKGEVTKTKFIFSSAIANIGGQTGGIMVFGTNRNTNQSVRFVLSNEPIELENGVWDFIYTSWDGQHSTLSTSSNQLEGTLRCGESLNINLNGAETPVTMTLSASNCSSAYFGSAATKDSSGIPKDIDFYACSNESVFGEEGAPADCAFAPGGSFQVSLPELLPNGEERSGLVSRCIENTNTAFTSLMENSSNAHEIRIPMFLPVIGKPIVGVKVFEDSNCGTLISQTKIKHFYAQEYEGSYFTLHDDNSNAVPNSLMVRVNVCNTTDGIGTDPFEYLAGHYILCTKDQFSFLNTGSNNTFEYIIDQDINFQGQVFTENVVDSLSVGGVINGQGHTLSNFEIDSSAVAPTGFIGSLSGTIRNLTLDEVTVNCSLSAFGAGALVGKVPNDGELSQIGLKNIIIDSDGCSNVGGLIGKVLPGSGNFLATSISAQNITVEFDENSSIIGGLVGHASRANSSQTNFSDISANGISLENSGVAITTKYHFGGLFGSLSGPSTSVSVRNVLATNIEIGDDEALDYKSKIGLFAGSIGLASLEGPQVDGVKVQGLIAATANSSYIGGIAGTLHSSDTNNLISNITISAGDSDYVGGAYGIINGSTFDTDISLIRTSGTIECSGRCGGVIGHSESSGSIDVMEVFSDMSITSLGSSEVGGIVGKSELGSFDQVQFSGVISGTSSEVGGIVGTVHSGNISSFSNIVSYGDVSGSTEVGGVAGKVDFMTTGTGFTYVLSNTDVTATGANNDYSVGYVAGGTVSMSDCHIFDSDGSGVGVPLANCSSVTNESDFDNLSLIHTNLSSSSYFFDGLGSELSELSFVNSLGRISGLTNLGSRNDPFSITTRAGWNSISDTVSLMDKSFKLDADIDFNLTNGDFTPIGSEANPFKGNFLGNNHTLSNITYISSDPTEPIGIFRKITATNTKSATILDRPDGNEYNRLIIDNASFEYTGTVDIAIGVLAGVVKDFNDNTEENPVRIAGITIKNSDVKTSSSATAALESGAGGLIGHFEIGSGNGGYNNTSIEQVILSEVTVDTSGSTFALGSGGMIGAITKNTNLTNAVDISGIQLNGITVDGGTDSNSVGGLVGHAINPWVEYENLLLKDISLDGLNSVGGLFGNADFKSVNVATIKELTITAAGNEVGGILGLKGAAASTINAVNVIADSLSGVDEVGCLGGDLSGTLTIDNSYFICPTLSGTTTSHFSLGTGTMTIGSSSVFYVAPTDETITGTIYFADDSNLRDPDYMINNYPNFLSVDPWIMKNGDLPITLLEEHPEHFFY